MRQLVGVKLEPEEMERVERIAHRRFWTKSQATRYLVLEGLKRAETRLLAETPT